MSAAGFTPIQLYRSTTASAVPTSGNLADGELAINTNDGKLYYKDSGGAVQLIASKAGASGDVVGPASATDNAVVRFDNTTGKLVQNSVVTIADSTGDVAGVGALTASGNLTLSGGTANGVLYLNGSKVATSGSALVFDGTNLGVGCTPSSFANFSYISINGATGSILNLRSGNTSQFEINTTGTLNNFSSLTTLPFVWSINNAEKMRLASATGGVGALGIGYTNLTSVGDSGLAVLGNVGIGTSSPSNKLHVTVSAASTAVSAFYNTDTSNGNGVYIKAGGSNSGKYALAIDNAASSSLLYLDSSGNLGLGVTPSAWDTATPALQIKERLSLSGYLGNSYVTHNAYLATSGWKYQTSNPVSQFRFADGEFIWNTAASGTAGNAITFTQAMTLDASGNLGVITTSPTSFLSNWNGLAVGTTSGSNGIAIVSGTSSPGTLAFADGTSGADQYRGYIQYNHSSNSLLFGTNGANAVTIDTSGNLGLGVTPSAWASQPAIQQTGGALWGINAANYEVLQNAFYNGTNYIYRNTNLASRYNQNAGVHSWYTAPSGTAGNAITFTQAMTLDAGGNLLVGGTSSLYGVGGRGDVEINGSSTSILALTIAGSATNASYLYNTSTELEIAATGSRFMRFTTNGTERARITSGGDLLVGTTSAVAIGGRNSKVNVVQSADGVWAGGFVHSTSTGTEAFGVAINYSASAPNSSLNPFLYCTDNTAVRAEIRSNGGLANYSANDANLSDRREKTNFAPAGEYLSKICAIPVQTFNYIDQSEDDPGLTLGVVAQDVQAVAPELVMESNWGTKENPKMRLSIYQTDLQYALMKCIQEQQALIESLTSRVAQLEGTQP